MPIPSVVEDGAEIWMLGATTLRIIVVVLEIDPDVPVMVIVYVPTAAAELAVSVNELL